MPRSPRLRPDPDLTGGVLTALPQLVANGCRLDAWTASTATQTLTAVLRRDGTTTVAVPVTFGVPFSFDGRTYLSVYQSGGAGTVYFENVPLGSSAGPGSGAAPVTFPTRKSVLVGFYNVTTSTTALSCGFGGGTTSTGSVFGTILPYAATISNFYGNVVANSLNAADTYTATLNVYSAPGGSLLNSSLTFGFAGGATGVQSDTSHSYSASAGVMLCCTCQSSAGSGTLTMFISLEADPA